MKKDVLKNLEKENSSDLYRLSISDLLNVRGGDDDEDESGVIVK